MYGKLVNGELQYANNQLIIDGKLVVNPTEKQYNKQGFYQIEYTESPKIQDGYIANSYFILESNKLVQKWNIEKDNRDYSDLEIMDMYIRQNIQTLNVTDQQALQMKDKYPTFEDCIGQTIEKAGFKLSYDEKLWKTKQNNLLIQKIYPPSVETAALYEVINEEHSGGEYDPIPYDINLAVEIGKYYVYNDIVYKCIRDSGQPLYTTPDTLIGNYFEMV